MNRTSESQALDQELLRAIHAWHKGGVTLDDQAFEKLALRILAYQLRYNTPYAQFCASRGVTEQTLPASWEDIPAIPTGAFKEASLTTFDLKAAALSFETSGTTRGIGGMHYMETNAVYDAALLATFDRLVLTEPRTFRYLNLVPNPTERPSSSLGYMMGKISRERGDGKSGWYIRGDELRFDAFIEDAKRAIAEAAPVFLAGTAFAFVQLCDAMIEREYRLVLPPASLVMETGGFKGRSRIVKREDLYSTLTERFGIEENQILAEYGMTELTSQYYDMHGKVKVGPPWLRPRVVGTSGETLPRGTVGALIHLDLANTSSCIAVQTEDLGAQVDGGIVLLGREQGTALRGCSLDAEALHAQ